MPIGLGLASSHAPSVVAKLEHWGTYYTRLAGDVPQPPEAKEESQEVLASYIDRIEVAFATLRQKLADYRPDVLIIIGGDQSEMFDRSNVPNLMIYVGEEAWGHNHNRMLGEQPSEANAVRLKVDTETSRWLLRKLVAEDEFDVAFSTEQCNLGQPERGLPHAFARPAPLLMPNLDIPVVLVYESTYDPPSLSAQRCYDFGRAIGRLLRKDSRRIAIYGSGGLSHDPMGPRSGWIDKPLDQWFLKQIAAGNGHATGALYSFDSMTMRGGTGEIRAWITVAGAMEEIGSHAEIVDYIPAHHAVTGLGWAYWETESRVPRLS
jgi:protocatechuate 4,5-dioxygenase beta chain